MLSEFADIVNGKTVALVGNAKSLYLNPRADEIDGHDVVVRINMGIPRVVGDYGGSRTDVWATAKYFGVEPKCKLGLFMKLTRMGDEHWKWFQRKRREDFPIIRWPQPLEDEVKDFVGADPGTGIRLLYFLKRHAAPKSVGVFGMDCWATNSVWSGKSAAPAHNPSLEKAAMERLLA